MHLSFMLHTPWPQAKHSLFSSTIHIFRSGKISLHFDFERSSI